ncbi:MAG: haloacid dehalogenase-like hydrolase [Desulfarculaceae bacterium]|nr:haloacid dehalogenase-like hydrolase [Desulfarculaceae bacterium]MCF8048044.1 haloacid dehalogenase-like hydrolase [Desulfarculaceae bacterium]MCF8097680.1 haloacid dehalogenase-like hydrolase [Desulfarculaceae bacterium]MCF8123710.1 haloacid dehalogenase-like hydrolase [Desulfarculaceae bacterium]
MRVKALLRCSLPFLLVLALASAAQAAEPLASWREPLRGQILAYAAQAVDPASPGFVPAPERVAAFDLDGTLITERPNFFVLEVALKRLRDICPAFGKQGPKEAELCLAVAGKKDRRWVRKNLDQVLSLPFKGMSFAQYRELVSQVWNQGMHPKHKRPFKDTVFKPMRELVAHLKSKGFTVYINSGADELSLMAICADLGVEPTRCIGTRYQAEPREQGGRVELVRTGLLDLKFLNLGVNKAVNMYFKAGRAPVLAAGNSSGDSWLLKMAGDNPRPHMVLVVNHDDPKEAVYSRPELLALAKERGWRVVSMRGDWLSLFE